MQTSNEGGSDSPLCTILRGQVRVIATAARKTVPPHALSPVAIRGSAPEMPCSPLGGGYCCRRSSTREARPYRLQTAAAGFDCRVWRCCIQRSAQLALRTAHDVYVDHSDRVFGPIGSYLPDRVNLCRIALSSAQRSTFGRVTAYSSVSI
jgi:hypothetical protein